VNVVANVKNNSASQETRRRLLTAAGEIFAEHGFHLATIKQITDRAGASLASVNYHFVDKAALYAAVLQGLAEESVHLIPPDEKLNGDATNRLRQFIQFLCNAMMNRERVPWKQVLLAREMAEPTAALDPLFDRVMLPITEKLATLVSELMELPKRHRQVGLVTAAIFGQCVYYVKHRAMIGRIHPQLGDSPDVAMLADHIAEFSLAGLRAAKKKPMRV